MHLQILFLACLIAAGAGAGAAHQVAESAEDAHAHAHAPGSNTTTTLHPVRAPAAATAAAAAVAAGATNRTDRPKISSSATWKIETTFSESNLTDSNSTESKEIVAAAERPANGSKEFKPSQNLGSYVEVTSPEIGPTKEPFGFSPVIKKPPVGFYGSQKSDHKSPFKLPKEVLKNYNEFPYTFEKAIYTRAKKPTEDPWRPNSGLEPTPTDEAPIRLPAGGLYKLPDAFKENTFKDKPSITDGDFGLEFSDAKEQALRKRPNPWSKLLHLVAALVPVGIIFSALTPNVVAVRAGAGGDSGIASQRPYRHVDTTSGNFLQGDHHQAAAPPNTPPTLVSEQCRRRLLCELHADYNYNTVASRSHPRRFSRCQRIRCEDTEALADTLHFLLSHHPPPPPAPQRRTPPAPAGGPGEAESLRLNITI